VRLTGGRYFIGDGGEGQQGVKIGNNTQLLLDHDAVIIRNFRSGGDGGATIRNKVQSGAGNEHIRLSGGTIKSENLTLEGHHVGFQNVDFLTISDIEFRGVRDWNMSLRNCDDVIVSNLSMKSGTATNSAGVQITGGARIVIADCDITCGDDAIALVCDVNPGSANISDVAISNCYLHSLEANPLKILVEENVPFTISRVTVSNIVAKAGHPNSTSS
jgi:polygalacturonase